MAIFSMLCSLSLIVLIILLFLWFRARRNKTESKITGKILGYAAGFWILFLALTVIFPTSDSNEASSSSESSSSISSSSSSSSSSQSTTENDILAGYSAKELKSYNSGLIDSLNEDQGYANNGKKEYNASLYIDTLGYSSRGLIVKVTSEFASLDKDSKTVVGQYAQKLANAQVVLQGDNVSEESTPTTQIYYGAKKIGHSKLTNGTEFKWEKA
ncbi:hypothetical protein [Levilactobacillus yiduensis]|uniref:hypothetical protein n=1 Tax=Levilactobacillus yiduensis TaxID=2953880 RepID=UPI002157F558|nr:hypothetical protein [Levilactobacillus yiduensis]